MGRYLSKPLEDYGLIGNTVSAALVSFDGAIDWLCLPRFDSPACFAALLGAEDNGTWVLKPKHPIRKRMRAYRPGTAILETTFETARGRVTVIDFMPPTQDETTSDVVRIVRGDRGKVPMSMSLRLRFNYGSAVPWVRRRDYGLSAVAGPDAIELHTPVEMTGENMHTTAAFTVKEGDMIPFTLSYHRAHLPPHFVRDSRESLDLTNTFWREWIEPYKEVDCAKNWSDAIVRSLITLKLLTYRPTGGIVAAPTTSLPETLGGARNWDYRFCWLRDSALTLYALVNAGLRNEAAAWREWLLRAVAGRPSELQIMYGIAGERTLLESTIPWLEGYEKSTPVRIGNAAAAQLQLDVFGELMDTLHAAREAGLPAATEAWSMQLVLLDHLEKIWKKHDRGIWEVRGPERIFTHSRAMCWVAFDRAIASATRFKLPAPLDLWRKRKNTIARDILRHGVDEKGRFVQYYGGSTLDASLLLLVQLGFVKASDARFKRTLKGIETELVKDGFVKRYSESETDDGLGGAREGAFLPCNFWLADAYILSGRITDAEELFERLLGVRNDLGLLSEEYDPCAGRMVGNFPQAFSHVALVNTAMNLLTRKGPAHQRATKTAPRKATLQS